MAQPYDLDHARADDLFPRSLGERVIGSAENQRSTKTFIPNTAMAVRLALLGNHADKLGRLLARVRDRERMKAHAARMAEWEAAGSEGEPPAVPAPYGPDDAKRDFTSVQVYQGAHLQVLEQLASLKGYSLKVVARAESLRVAAQHGNESSISLDGMDDD